jgi:hypothetical protein
MNFVVWHHVAPLSSPPHVEPQVLPSSRPRVSVGNATKEEKNQEESFP